MEFVQEGGRKGRRVISSMGPSLDYMTRLCCVCANVWAVEEDRKIVHSLPHKSDQTWG